MFIFATFIFLILAFPMLRYWWDFFMVVILTSLLLILCYIYRRFWLGRAKALLYYCLRFSFCLINFFSLQISCFIYLFWSVLIPYFLLLFYMVPWTTDPCSLSILFLYFVGSFSMYLPLCIFLHSAYDSLEEILSIFSLSRNKKFLGYVCVCF